MAEQKVIDLPHLLRPYEGKWVALDENKTRVVGFGDSIEEALKVAKKSGVSRPIILKASNESSSYFL